MINFKLSQKHTIKHRDEIISSEICGCYKCLKTLPPQEIDEWWDDEQTATCPYCGIDSVVGSASGYPISAELLKEMRIYWFNGRLEPEEE